MHFVSFKETLKDPLKDLCDYITQALTSSSTEVRASTHFD